MSAADLAALGRSLALLHDASLAPAQRKAAEEALLAFRASPAAWAVCLGVLCPPEQPAAAQQQQQQQQQPELELFAAQTLRAKINAGGAQLQPHQLAALRDQLLRRLAAPVAGAALLRQLALALCSVAALLPSWGDVVGAASGQLPAQHAVELLRLLAEEGASDWRHIALPGLSSSQQLDWASATRERFRSWSPGALGLLHGWLQQHAADTQARVLLLSCMTAWVQLGALHQARSSEPAQQTAQAGLACIQSCNEQEVAAGLRLLQELPEYAPEQLLRSLQPAMIQMAQSAASLATADAPAAAAAAAAGTGLCRASEWVQAFAAHAMACPQRLLAAATEAQQWTLRDALLQLSVLPQVHEGQLLCLPALEVWGTLLDADLASWRSGGTLATTSGGSSRQLLQALQDADADTDGETAGDACPLPDAFVRSCQQLLLHTAANYIGWLRSADGRQALEDERVAAAVSDALQLCCQALGAQAYLRAITQFVWSGPGSIPAPSGPLAALLDVPELEPLPGWQQRQLQAAVASIAAAPEQLRLFAAVLMAAAVHIAPAAADSAAAEQQDRDAQWSNRCNVDVQAAGIITQLLSNAAAAMQQLGAAGSMADLQLPQLVTHFCVAVKAWAVQLVRHFSASAGGMQALHGLLGLLLGVAAHGEEAAAAAAAAGMRAVVTAAVEERCQLHEFALPLMQAVQSLPCAGTTEQDLLASLSGCLAAAGASEQELQQLRSAAAQQLVLPAVAALEGVLQQLHAAAWPAIAVAADAALCHHLMRVRAVLEGRLLLQQQRAHLQQQSDGAAAQAAAGACPSSEEGRSPRAGDREAADALADQLADTAMDEDVRAAGAAALQLQALQLAGRGGSSSSSRALAALAADPAIQLLLEQLLPSLNALVTQQPAAAGKFIVHHAKCCTRLLRLHPGLLLPQLQQLLQAAVAAMPRPGGSALAEPFAAAIELSCRHGSGLLLDSSHHITQAMGELWAAPDVAALARPGAGDERPDLAEPVLKLSNVFIKHSRSLQPSGVTVTVAEAALLAAAACAGAAHAKVAATALSLLAALLAAAGAAGPQQQQLLAVVARHAARAGGGVFAALLAPSPLPRLSKATTALTELAAAAQQLQARGEGPAAPLDEQLLHAWLLQAASALLAGDEAAALARNCAGMLASGVRSYVACRQLKRRLRDLAEAHMRPAAAAGGGRRRWRLNVNVL